jgi:hypothetical protein
VRTIGVGWPAIGEHTLWSLCMLLVALLADGGAEQAGASDGEPAARAIVLELEVPPEVPRGATIPLTLRLRNASDQPVEVALGGRPAHDVVITQADGVAVWRWTHGQVVPQILALMALGPGQELEFTAEWTQHDNAGTPVPAGDYRVRGLVNLGPLGWLETQPTSLRVVPTVSGGRPGAVESGP